MAADVAATTGDCVVTIGGDIASGSPANFTNAQRTGDLVRSIAPTYALTAGDNAYDSGTLAEYQAHYEPTWGSFKAITRPSPGNHEYRDPGAQGYFSYFFGGVRQGNEYYATDCGTWRLYSLNCEIACGDGSAQLAWLQADLASRPGGHYLAYLHRPRFTSGSNHAPNTAVSPLYRALQAAGGDIIVGGHNHHYERFGKQNADGQADPRGLRQFVSGSGGASLYGFGTPRANSQYRNATQFGVLRLELSASSYAWQFLSAGRAYTGSTSVDDTLNPFGTVLDTGSDATNNGAAGNRAPVVDAGADQQVRMPGSASLAATVSDDGLPSPPGALAVSWSKVSGPGDVTFSAPRQAVTEASFSVSGSYRLRVTADDSALTSSDEVAVTVLARDAPTVVDVAVAAGSDDAEEAVSSGAVNLASTDLELVTDGTARQAVGVRFAKLPVPAGATVLSAWVQFQVDEVSTAATSLTVRAVAADNTPTFTTARGNVSSRPRTAASVAWSPPSWSTVGAKGTGQRTPNLAAVLQEVVGRPGWASGNAVAIVVTGSGRRTAEAKDGGIAPILHVEYRTG